MNVLLTNDDGITAPGLRALYRALKEAGHNVFAVAPMAERSGVGHSLTVFEPLRSRKISGDDFEGMGVHGTPTDCVKLGLGDLAPFRPDLVMAGINLGQNVGPDIFYSGTVGAAAEACHDSLPSMAVSYANHKDVSRLPNVAKHAVTLAGRIAWDKLPPRRVINVNYPANFDEKCAGVRVCPQSPAVWGNVYNRREDPAGQPYWWLQGSLDESTYGENTDKSLLLKDYVTITPLKFEYTDHDALPILRQMNIEDEH